MYQSFKPKTEGVIFAKRSMPQGAKKSPHDTTTSFVKLAAFGTYKGAKGRGRESIDSYRTAMENGLSCPLTTGG
jgi:hypothetical protein